MKRANVFWGSVLIFLGMLFYLQVQNIIPSVLPFLLPLALLFAGSWLILSVYWKPKPSADDSFQFALGEAKSVSYKFSHGAGQIEITGGAPLGTSLVGTSGSGMERKSHMNGDRLDVKIEAGASFVPFVGPPDGIWRFRLTQEVPVRLSVETGASQLDLDLRNVLAGNIELETGASNTNVIMPANGASNLDIEAGAASINITMPDGVSGRIRIKEGLTSLNIDTNRFPQLDSRLYQSADFDNAVNRAEIKVEAGLGSVTIK